MGSLPNISGLELNSLAPNKVSEVDHIDDSRDLVNLIDAVVLLTALLIVE